jgi:pimeloyl-ACP methyl ester carboxylesterase
VKGGLVIAAWALALGGAGAAAQSAGTGYRAIAPVGFTSAGSRLVYYPLAGGTGLPLVLISGGPGFDSEYFKLSPAWGRLTHARRIIFYDQRGTGRSAGVWPTSRRCGWR